MEKREDPPAADREFARARTVHIVGICGSGARGLARIFAGRGVRVSGSDRSPGETADALRALGVVVRVGHGASALPPDAEIVIRSAAIPDENPEIVEAKRRGIPCLKYAEAVGWLTRQATTVAVAGTHGKSTTTAMLARILEAAGMAPGILVGADYDDIGGGGRWGDPFIVEACEYDRSFLRYASRAAVITNIEADHLDYYRDLDEIREAFAAFLLGLPSGSPAIVGREALVPEIRKAAEARGLALDDVGDEPGCAWRIVELRLVPHGARFVLIGPEGVEIPIALRVPGIHNARDAALAAAMGLRLGAGARAVRAGLARFRGVRRRFEILSRRDGITIVDDYAHHPTEVRAVLAAARHFARGGRVRAVFQPHQHSRFRRFLREFADALLGADDVIVIDIYAARDPLAERGISAEELVRLLAGRGRPTAYCCGEEEAGVRIRETARAGDVILFLGAGDITNLAQAVAGEPMCVGEGA
ncbi:MAG: UDP-N-acetylmuramate--L-alanine ligase [Planctomycetes bacterium]|nr:UDP-N-acetylmuramate--L-alanine ligase [Planctomycetota bacterium]